MTAQKRIEGKDSIWVAHRSPGRIRFHFDSAKQDVPNLNALFEISGVEEVSFNKLTKSLLLVYATTALSEKSLFSHIRKKLPNLRLSLKKSRSRDNALDGNLLSQWIYDSGTLINKKVNALLSGSADLTSIVPTLLIAWGLEELIKNPMMPKWYDILRAAGSTLSQFSHDYEN